jgi:hypothetical protein
MPGRLLPIRVPGSPGEQEIQGSQEMTLNETPGQERPRPGALKISQPRQSTQNMEMAHVAARYGLAPLSGSAPGVGAVGYTLAAGSGCWPARVRLRHIQPD